MSNLEKKFRDLREAWFNAHLRSYAHEREWESEAKERLRDERNVDVKVIYDRQTEEIIAGHDRPLTPSCGADLDVDGA